MKHYFAVDLGASNGRTILGRFDGGKLTLEEINRFENNYVRVQDGYYWDVLRLYGGILEGLGRYAKEHTEPLCGIGIDTWGVDFGLVDRQGRIVGNPRSYRDPRGARGMKTFHEKYGERTAFDISGIANLEFNTLYQLYDMALQDDPQLHAADKMLMMPDLLGYMLCGEMSTEYTDATTTQMLNCRTGSWSPKLLEMAGVDESLLTGIRMSGEVKGQLVPTVLHDTGLAQAANVICVGSHDTASAVASVPAKTENYAYISSGTWSLMGVVSDRALMGDAVYNGKFSNEGTITGGYRPLRNIMGLWIIQCCKRVWDRESSVSWDDIVSMAKAAPAFASFIDVGAHDFFAGEDMPLKIQRYCASTGQRVPHTRGEIARTVYESLAMSYRDALEGLEQIKGSRIDTLHIVGGGAKNALLNRFAACAIGREVVAGPYEATAIGNLMMQVKASGEVKDFAEMREVIARSFAVDAFRAAGYGRVDGRLRAVPGDCKAREHGKIIRLVQPVDEQAGSRLHWAGLLVFLCCYVKHGDIKISPSWLTFFSVVHIMVQKIKECIAMKRCCAILLVLVVLTATLLAACTKDGAPEPTPTQTPGMSSTPTSVPTTPPDFEDIDFSGTWIVSKVLDSSGVAVSPEQISTLGADFTLELSQSGAYFLYDAQGALLGQGEYRVAQAELILSAGEMQTIYAIQDANTLRCTADDGSVTVMKRLRGYRKRRGGFRLP